MSAVERIERMRCPDCNKFASFDTEVDPEFVSESAEGTEVTVEVRRVLSCADCGTELKEYTFELSEDFSGQVEVEEGEEECDHEWSIDVSVSPTVNVVDKDKNGRQIKNARYMKTMYGVEVTCDLECDKCKNEVRVEFNDEAQASSFEELT